MRYGKVVVALFGEHALIEMRAGTQDLRYLALNQFARLGVLDLFADGNLSVGL